MLFGTLNYGESTYVILTPIIFLLFRTFYAFYIFHFKIDSPDEYSLATDTAANFTCFKPKYYKRKSSFYLFSIIENPVKSRKNPALCK